MQIPEFPNSREILIEDKPVFDKIFAENPPEISAYTFTNLFAWRYAYRTTISLLNGFIIVCHNSGGKLRYLEPLGTGDMKAVFRQILEFDSKEPPIEFIRLHKHAASQFEPADAYVIEKDRDDSDYLYSAEDLIQLPGRKYDAKRNFINRFKQHGNYTYEQITSDNVAECEEFADRWCEERKCQTGTGLHKELCAIHEMLAHLDALGIVGGILRTDSGIAAFSLGEALNPETLVVHIEKADPIIPGTYQMINCEFCAHETNGMKYVNREQDLGVPGLRKAKKSYHPVRLVDTYWIHRADSA